jgi:hypothetical protein
LLAALGGAALAGMFWAALPVLAQKGNQPAVKPQPLQQTPPSQAASNVLVGQEFRLVDPNGRIRARLTPAPEEGVNLAIYHRDGKYMTVYRLDSRALPGMTQMPIPKTE